MAQNLEILEKLTSLGGSTFLFGYMERKKYQKFLFQNFATPPGSGHSGLAVSIWWAAGGGGGGSKN